MKIIHCTHYELIVRNPRTGSEVPAEPSHLAAAGYFPREQCQDEPCGEAAKKALRELIHVANLHQQDGSTVTLQVEFLRPRLLAIRACVLKGE